MGEVRRDIANGGGLSHPLLSILEDIKKENEYRRYGKDHTRIHEYSLYKILYLYMKARNALDKSFKARYFNKRHIRNYGHSPVYEDCPLTYGEFGSAVRYGRKEELLTNIGSNRNHQWKFTEKAKEMGI